MYQIAKNQIGCRLTDDERVLINEVLTRLQENNDHNITSIKEALLLIAENTVLTQEKTEEITPNNTENMVLYTDEAYKEVVHRAYKTGVNSDEPIDIGALTVISSNICPPPPPKEVDENEIFLNLSTDQLEIAKEVQENRAEKLEKQDEPKESIEELFMNCFFNEGNIYSFNGGWFTGL